MIKKFAWADPRRPFLSCSMRAGGFLPPSTSDRGTFLKISAVFIFLSLSKDSKSLK